MMLTISSFLGSFWDKVSSRIEDSQRTEVNIKCKILNKFTIIVIPKSAKFFKK